MSVGIAADFQFYFSAPAKRVLLKGPAFVDLVQMQWILCLWCVRHEHRAQAHTPQKSKPIQSECTATLCTI